MAGQLLPPPELAAPVPDRLTPAQRVALWVDLVDTCEEFLLAGFRRTAKSEEEVQAMYRAWYAQRMEEHDRMMLNMMARLDQSLD